MPKGRLVLCDALYVERFDDPEVVIDIPATLTGACVVALASVNSSLCFHR